jgi:hypothetical protein
MPPFRRGRARTRLANLAAVGLDHDPEHFQFGAALQCLLDLLLDLKAARRLADPNLVHDIDDAGELVHGLLGIGFPITPLDLAAEGHDAPLDPDRDPVGGKPGLPVQNVDRARRDLVICMLAV